MGLVWLIFTHKWTQCGHCVILGPRWIMLLYNVHVGNWIELLIQRRLCLIFFVKLWIPVNGTHKGVSGYTMSTGFHGLMGDQRTLGFWGVTTWHQSIGMQLLRA